MNPCHEPDRCESPGGREADRFLQCLSSYGASPQHWPEADRPLFVAFSCVAWAQEALASAQELDLWLSRDAQGPSLPAGWAARTLSSAFAARSPEVALVPIQARPPVVRAASARTRLVRMAPGLLLGMGLMGCSLGGFAYGFESAIQAAAQPRAQGPGAEAAWGDEAWLARWQEALKAGRSQSRNQGGAR